MYLEFSICLAKYILCILTCDCDNVQMTLIYADWVNWTVCVCMCISMGVCIWHLARALHLDSVLTQ